MPGNGFNQGDDAGLLFRQRKRFNDAADGVRRFALGQNQKVCCDGRSQNQLQVAVAELGIGRD